MANPVGWDPSWGTYEAGKNDFSTVIAKGDAETAAKAQEGRNKYLDSQGGTVSGSNGQTYGKESTESIKAKLNGGSSNNNSGGNNTGGNNYTTTDVKNGNTQNTATTLTYDKNANYAALAEQAAKSGDWTKVDEYLALRQAKIEGEGNDYGVSNAEYLTQLKNQYGTKTTTYKIKLGNGYRNQTGTVEYDPTTGSLNVEYDDGSAPSPLDFVLDANDNIIGFYVEDEDYTGWVTGDQEAYANYVSWYNSAQMDAKLAAQQEAIAAQYQELYDQLVAQNEAATEMSVNEIIAQLENGLSEYETLSSETYLQMMQNQDALVAQNAANGNTGGIAQKQYSSAQAAYDSQLLSIALERENFINTCNQTIAQLEAEGRYNEASILSEWAQAKISALNEAYEFAEQMKLQYEQFNYEKETTDRNYYYQRALTLLNQGMLTTDALTALGISEADAKAYVNRLNTEANINLEAAQLQLKALYNEVNGTDNTSYTPSETPGSGLPSDANSDILVLDSDGNIVSGAYYSSSKGGYFDAKGNRLTGTIQVTLADGTTASVNADTNEILDDGSTSKPDSKNIWEDNPAYNDADMYVGVNLGLNKDYTGLYKGVFGGTSDNSTTGDQQKNLVYAAVDGMTTAQYQAAKKNLTNALCKQMGADGLAKYFEICKMQTTDDKVANLFYWAELGQANGGISTSQLSAILSATGLNSAYNYALQVR